MTLNYILNEDSEVFNYKTSTLDQIDLSWVWNFTSNKHEFVIGNRNNFVYSFACNANRYGVDISDTLTMLILTVKLHFLKKR